MSYKDNLIKYLNARVDALNNRIQFLEAKIKIEQSFTFEKKQINKEYEKR
tara:strand:+ start:1285 stop:1434 length:150 start_codon:yes stop_codon:yes gene_type:complete